MRTESAGTHEYWPNKVAGAFHRDRGHQIHCLVGPWGCGKSAAAAHDVVHYQQRHPDQDVLVVRETYSALQDSVMTLWRKFFNTFGVFKGSPPDWHWKSDISGVVKFRSGEDPSDVQKFLSVDVGMAWLEEVTPGKETSGRQNQGLNPELFAGIWARTRACLEERRMILTGSPPPNEKHWTYRLFYEHLPLQDQSSIVAMLRDMNVELTLDWDVLMNQMRLWKIPREDNLAYLPAGYTESIMPLLTTEDEVKRFILGEPGSSYGGNAVYPMYKDMYHLEAKLQAASAGQWYRGWDGGLTPACCWVQVTPLGQVRCLAEYQGQDIGLNDFIPQARQYEKEIFGRALQARDICDPSMFARDDNFAVSGNTIFRNHGLQAQTGAIAVWPRLQAVQKWLGTIDLFKIHPRCALIVEALRGAYIRKMMSGVAQDAPDKTDPNSNRVSHSMNCLEYVASRIVHIGQQGHAKMRLSAAVVDKLGQWPIGGGGARTAARSRGGRTHRGGF